MKDIYEMIRKNFQLFDTSNYPPNHSLYSKENKNVTGKFKDELIGKIMTEVCGLRSKLYNYLYFDEKEVQKHEVRCKGVKRKVVKNTINGTFRRSFIWKQLFVSQSTVNSELQTPSVYN